MWRFALVICLLPGAITGFGPLQRLSERYFILGEDVTFVQALTQCAYYGMEMPSVSTLAKNLELIEVFNNSSAPYNYFWIAGTYQNTSSRKGWTWLTSKDDFTYTSWRASEPTVNEGEDTCVRWGHFSSPDISSGMWTSRACSEKYGDILCEIV